MKVRKTWIVVASVAVIVLVAWYRGWFSGEPTYHGKTVTQWLDSMALFDEDRNAELTGQNTFRYQRSPEVVTNDPALHALLLSGSNTVAVLVKRLTEPFQWPRTIGPVSRLRIWAEWKWYRLRNPGSAAPRPAPNDYGSFQRARHMAAALALLALGTDANAGVPRLLEAYAASPPGATGNRDFSLYDAMLVANSGLPHRRAEMIAGVMAATHHTNAVIRSASANLTRVFPDQLSLWKEKLLKMTGDADTSVRIAATWALATEDRGDSDVLRLLEATLKDKANPARLRAYAASGLGLQGALATNSLPLLQEALSDTNRALNNDDRFLQRETRTAIRNIEKATAGDKAITPK